MTQIHFPTNHDADDLNDWLDALVTGDQMPPGNEVQETAARIHALGAAPLPVTRHQGGSPMTTATISLPLEQRAYPRPARNWSVWINAALVAAILVSLISVAWVRGPGTEPTNIAWAPQPPTMRGMAPLNPATSSWLADFSPEDCQGTAQSRIDLSNRVSNAEFGEQSYAIVRPANRDNTVKVNDAYRAMRGCDDGYIAANYWSDARVGAASRNLTESNLAELADLQTYFQGVYPDQFMITAVDVAVSNEIQAEWDTRAEFGVLGAPIPLSVKINPEWGVELSDSRIAFPATVVYAANDPAITANGLPVDSPATTVAMVFTYERDGWKYDDSLPLCLANCEFGIGNPLDPAVETWAVPPTIAECTAPATAWETISERMEADVDWTAGSTTIQGPAIQADAEAALTTYRIVDACNRYNQASESLGLYSDLGLLFFGPIQRGPVPQLKEDEEEMQLASRQCDLLRMEILATVPSISTTAVSQSFVGRYEVPGTNTIPVPTSNRDATIVREGIATIDGALMLEDGRIVLPLVRVIDMNDRGAIIYGGGINDQGTAAVLSNANGEWKIDYYMMWFSSGDFTITPRTHPWWEGVEQDVPPGATETSPVRGGDNQTDSGQVTPAS